MLICSNKGSAPILSDPSLLHTRDVRIAQAVGPVAQPPQSRTQSDEAKEQPQEQQPGEQQAQQPLPPAAAGAAGAPGRRCPPRAPAVAAYTANAPVLVVVDFCGRQRKGKGNAAGSCLFAPNSLAFGDFPGA